MKESEGVTGESFKLKSDQKLNLKLQKSSLTRMMIARHPLTRLFSGWNEHMGFKPDAEGENTEKEITFKKILNLLASLFYDGF